MLRSGLSVVRQLLVGVLALGTVLFAFFARSPDASAEPIGHAVHLRYSAPPACPSEADFVAALRLDTDPFELTSEAEAQRRVDVDLEVLLAGARGRFRLVDGGHGTTIQRELTGPDCEAVARALALMVALTMQRLSEPPSPAPGFVTPAPESPPAPPLPRAPPAEVRPPRRHQLSAELQGGLTGAVVDDALPFVAMALQIEPRIGRFRPALAISVRQSLPTAIPVAGGQASFLWTAAALRLCPQIIVIASFDLAPCLEASLGRLHADANGLPGARSSTELWGDGSLLIAGRWHFSARWYLTATALATVAFTRSRFTLSSGALISETPAAGIGGSLGVGVAF